MMVTARKPLTLNQFLKIPEQEPALEFEEGRITQKVSPRGQHSAVQSGILELFNRYGMPRRLARAFPELRFTFRQRSYVPDVAIYLWDRVLVDERGQVSSDPFPPPDIAIEIASPEQSIGVLIAKCQWYVDNEVKAALLADPADASLRYFRPGQPHQTCYGDERIDLGAILPGFELTARQVFASLEMR